MARSLAYLWAVGATMLALTVVLPHGAGVNDLALLAEAGVAYVMAVVMLGVRGLPPRAFDLIIALGSLMISGAVVLSGSAASAYAFFLVWLTLHAFYFLSWARAAPQLIWILVLYGGAVLVSPSHGDARAVRFAMVSGTLLVTAAFVGLLKARVERLLLELRESKERLDALLHNSSDMITVVAVDGTVLYQAGSVRSVLGHPPSQLVGTRLTDWVDPDDAPLLLTLCQTAEVDGAEIALRHADGSLRTCEVRATSLLDHPAWAGVVLNIRDVSDRKRLEVELRLAQKLESVGALAAGIAHEINTPIQYVSSSVEFLDDAFADIAQLQDTYAALRDAAVRGDVDAELLARVSEAEETADLEYLRERVPAALERSRDGLARVAKIVGAMRVFGHPPTSATAPVDINAAIENTLVVAANEYKYVADLTTDLDDLPPVLSNGGDINQVLINLIVNASHAIADIVDGTAQRGAIHIRTHVQDDHAVITVADTDGGIPAEIADRVFDPFFTTKQLGRGTGQGLAIARTIIDRHDGELTFTTRAGDGTTFTIRLPLTPPGLASIAAA